MVCSCFFKICISIWLSSYEGRYLIEYFSWVLIVIVDIFSIGINTFSLVLDQKLGESNTVVLILSCKGWPFLACDVFVFFFLEVLGASDERQLKSVFCLFLLTLVYLYWKLTLICYDFELKFKMCFILHVLCVWRVGIGKHWAIWVFSLYFVLDVVVFFRVIWVGAPVIVRQ